MVIPEVKIRNMEVLHNLRKLFDSDKRIRATRPLTLDRINTLNSRINYEREVNKCIKLGSRIYISSNRY